MKASLALLCLALACTAYAADINVGDLHKQLTSVDPRYVPSRVVSSAMGSFADTKSASCLPQPSNIL